MYLGKSKSVRQQYPISSANKHSGASSSAAGLYSHLKAHVLPLLDLHPAGAIVLLALLSRDQHQAPSARAEHQESSSGNSNQQQQPGTSVLSAQLLVAGCWLLAVRSARLRLRLLFNTSALQYVCRTPQAARGPNRLAPIAPCRGPRGTQSAVGG
jgi:hypothetical protein